MFNTRMDSLTKQNPFFVECLQICNVGYASALHSPLVRTKATSRSQPL